MPPASSQSTTEEKNVSENDDLIIEDADNEIMKEVSKEIPSNVIRKLSENSEEKQNLIFKIQKYQDSRLFGDIVKTHLGFKQGYDELNDKSINDLENMLSRIRIHLDNRNLDQFYERAAESMALVYEAAVSTVYDIDGFADLLLDSEDFWNIYERFKIENNFPAVNPAVQLAFIITQSTFMAHHTKPAIDPNNPQFMEPPPPLETILEGIEEDKKEEEKADQTQPNEDKKNNDGVEIPKPILLGQAL